MTRFNSSLSFGLEFEYTRYRSMSTIKVEFPMKSNKNNRSTDYSCDLLNLTMKERKLVKLFDKLYCSQSKCNTKDIYYPCFNLKKLKKTLLSTEYISKKYNIISGIVDIICEYHGTLDWSSINKSKHISIIPSKDKKISYAVLTKPESNFRWNETILFSESFEVDIGIDNQADSNSSSTDIKIKNSIASMNNDDDENGSVTNDKKTIKNGLLSRSETKSVFRFMFKCSEYRLQSKQRRGVFILPTLNIGFVTNRFKQSMAFTNVEFNQIIGDMAYASDGSSMSWKTDSDDCWFQNPDIQFGCDKQCCVNWNAWDNSFGFDNKSRDCYFMIEINFHTEFQTMTIICNALEDSIDEKKYTQIQIPQTILHEIEETKQFCLGLSLSLPNCASSFAVGFIKI